MRKQAGSDSRGARPSPGMAMTPAEPATYARADRLPLLTLFAAAFQHIGLMSVQVVFPLLVADAAGLNLLETANLVDLSMVAAGIGCLLQGLAWRGIGSGFLLPAIFTAAYLPPVLQAAKSQGLAGVAGLMIVAGVTEIILSRHVQRLRRLLPPEIMGFVVLQIGLLLGLIAVRLVLTSGAVATLPASPFGAPAVIVTFVALGYCALWGAPALRRVSVLVGLLCGLAAELATRSLLGVPLFPEQEPVTHLFPSLPAALPVVDPVLLPGVLLGVVACILRASGDIVLCQQAEDPRWRRPDFATIRDGCTADGIATLLAGLLGTTGLNTYSASVGLAIATGVRARQVVFAVGIGWILVGIVPYTATVLLALPMHVVGACLFFAACQIAVSGIAIIAQRTLDLRRSLVLGAGLILGISHMAAPELYAGIPDYARWMIGSSLTFSLLVVLGLNALLQAGTSQRVAMRWKPDASAGDLAGFAEAAGRRWALRVQSAQRLSHLVLEATELVALLAERGSEAELELRLTGTTVRAALIWAGQPLPAADRAPEAEMLLGEEAELARLGALLLRRSADRFTTGTADGRQRLEFTVED